MSKEKLTPQEIDYLIMLVEFYDSQFDIDHAVKEGMNISKEIEEALEYAHEKNLLLIEKLKRME